MTQEWICVKEAASLLGYGPHYSRRAFCDPEKPLLVIRQHRGPKGQRRILVLRASIERLIQEELREPA